LFFGRVEQYEILHSCRFGVFQGADEIGPCNPSPVDTGFTVTSDTG
jgi:hypothetical protein